MPEPGNGTVARALGEAAERLTGCDILAPEREARVLWAGLAGMHPAEVWVARDSLADTRLLGRFRDLVERRAAGEPLAYVLGAVGFRTLELKADRRAFIPRPETEGLVDAALRWARQSWGADGSWGAAADIGTGSGCIALSLAVEGRFERIVATDVSADALSLAAENLALVQPAVPVDLRQGRLLDALGAERFSAIVSNPPYVAERERADVERSVLDFEPAAALWSGPEGIDDTAALIAGAQHSLAPGGLLALELDSRRSQLAVQLARDGGWADATVERDLFGRNRFLLARWE